MAGFEGGAQTAGVHDVGDEAHPVSVFEPNR